MQRHTESSPDSANAAKLLATAAAIAAGTQAYGGAVRFENDTNFDWYFTTLDITRSAASQTFGGVGDVTGTSIYLDYFSDFYPAFTYWHSYTSGNGAELWNSGFSNRYSSGFNAGDQIGPGMSGGAWNQSSTLEFYFIQGDAYYVYPYGYYYTYTEGNRGLLPTDGSPAYIGVRLTIDSAQHYGWIGLTNSSGFIDVFAWGYETEAGVGIAAGVPAPGTMGLLAVGAAGVFCRRGKRTT